MRCNLDYIFILITLLWLGEFIIFPSADKSKESKTKSFSIILASILIIVIINAVMLLFDVFIVKISVLKIVALTIYALGLILRYYSLVLLGNNFTRNVEVEEEQELVSVGTYKYLRHPLYLGLFLLSISIPLYSGNMLLFVVSIVIMFKSIELRIKEEEKSMEMVIGKRYIEWKEKRYKFIPFIY